MSAFKILTGTPAGKTPLGRPRCGWDDSIRMNLKEIGINVRELSWFGSGQGLLESPCECSIEPAGSISHEVRVIAYLSPHNDSTKLNLALKLN